MASKSNLAGFGFPKSNQLDFFPRLGVARWLQSCEKAWKTYDLADVIDGPFALVLADLERLLHVFPRLVEIGLDLSCETR